MQGQKNGDPIRKVKTKLRSHWGTTNGVEGYIFFRPLRKHITMGDLKKDGWSSKHRNADNAAR